MTTRKCCFCEKETPLSTNYCNWECMVNSAKAEGGRIVTPNNLPIRCINADGSMLEVAHGDHQDYKFPVEIEYIGPVTDALREDYWHMSGEIEPESDDQVRDMFSEVHALIYTDGTVALTMYECNYAIWSVRTGECLGGRYVSKQNNRLKVPMEVKS